MLLSCILHAPLEVTELHPLPQDVEEFGERWALFRGAEELFF